MERTKELMSHEDYKILLAGPHADYYSGRWDYYREVVEIIKRENVNVRLFPRNITWILARTGIILMIK
ncbi:MAG: hypothetical protein KBA53_03755 [Thermoclostridium sp.]|nr:hypothetical protein [Thermoclostridium sp.]